MNSEMAYCIEITKRNRIIYLNTKSHKVTVDPFRSSGLFLSIILQPVQCSRYVNLSALLVKYSPFLEFGTFSPN